MTSLFFEKLGGYRKDRKTGVEGLTLAGLLMFGKGQAIRERFDNVFMDYRNESQVTADIAGMTGVTYDGTWKIDISYPIEKIHAQNVWN